MKNKEKERSNLLEEQCNELITIVRKLDVDDIKRVADIATGMALVREVEITKSKLIKEIG